MTGLRARGPRHQGGWAAPAILLALGLVPAFFGVRYALESLELLRGAETARGTVVGYTQQASRLSGTTQVDKHPVFRFTDASGREHEVTDPVGTGGERYARGAAVEVIYPPGRPEEARIRSFLNLWLKPLLFLAAAAPLLLLGGSRLLRALPS